VGLGVVEKNAAGLKMLPKPLAAVLGDLVALNYGI